MGYHAGKGDFTKYFDCNYLNDSNILLYQNSDGKEV
jgi:hypothetical protein